MALFDEHTARQLLDTVIAGFAVLGGTMAYTSGMAAAQAKASGEPPRAIGEAINDGIAEGFTWGALLAVGAIIIVSWS